MRIMAGAVIVAAGALLLGVAEVARSFSNRSGAGQWAATGGIVVGGIGLALLVMELYPPAWLRESGRDGGGGRSAT
jgi:uncharacterized membrane protein HdeD (DUF308 family)